MPKKFRIGVAQAGQSGDLGRNLREIARFVDHAATRKLDALLFPECALTGYGPAFHPSPPRFDPDAIDAAVMELREYARANRLAIIVGAHLPRESGWTNSLLCIRGDGRMLARYDKAHLYGCDGEYYRPGDIPGAVATVGGAKIGLQVCFDIRFPEPFRRLALRGARVIVVSSYIHGRGDMWKRPVIEAHVRSRAAENGRFVIFANAAGPYQNVPTMIADPRGEIVVEARRGTAEMLTADLDLSAVNNDFLSIRRTDLYGR